MIALMLGGGLLERGRDDCERPARLNQWGVRARGLAKPYPKKIDGRGTCTHHGLSSG